MNKKHIHQDVYIGFVGLLLCALIWAVNAGLPSNAGMMPRLLDGILAFLSAIILIQGLRKSKLPEEEQGKKAFTVDAIKIPVITWLLVVAYVALFKFTGYFVSTGVMLIVFMRFMKQTNWKVIIAITVIYLLLVYGVFVRMLGVSISGFGMLGRLF